ncbi:hypothetical protein GCM10027035_04270 [Emticicia sediminis]
MIFLSLSAFPQGSITLTPENTTIESRTNQPLIFSTAGAERMKITSSGNVGIGQSSPLYKLDILNNGGTGIRLKSGSTFTTIDIDAFNGDAALRFAKNGVIQWNVRNEPSSDDFQIFEFGGGGSRFQIQAGTGNIGIGTSTPKAKLHIFNGLSGIIGTPANELIVENSGNNYIQMMNPQTTEAGLLFGLPSSLAGGGIIYNNGERKALDFRTRNNATRMTIDSVGNVGVGTTNPTAKLDINGDVVIKRKKVLPLTTQTVNNLDRAGASIICTGTATSAQTITISGIEGGVDGMMLWVYPTNNFTIRLENEDAGSTAINRIKTTTGTANILSVRGGATLIYDGTEDRWHVIDTN